MILYILVYSRDTLKIINFSYLLLYNELPKTQRLNTAHIYYLMVFMGQEFRSDFTRSITSGFLLRLKSKCWPELRSHLKVLLGKYLHLSAHCYWQDLVPCGFWTEGFGFWLAMRGAHSQLLACGHLRHGSLLHQGQQERESAHKIELTSVTNNGDDAYHLLVRSKS